MLVVFILLWRTEVSRGSDESCSLHLSFPARSQFEPRGCSEAQCLKDGDMLSLSLSLSLSLYEDPVDRRWRMEGSENAQSGVDSE